MILSFPDCPVNLAMMWLLCSTALDTLVARPLTDVLLL